MALSGALSNLRRWVLHRRKKSKPAEPEIQYSPAKFSSALWDFSHLLGILTGCIFSAVLIVFAVGRSWRVKERLDAILPDEWFQRAADSTAPERVEQLRKDAKTVLRTPHSGSRRPSAEKRTFGLGSTKTEVLAAQGRPDQADGNTWRYGKSEVYFVQDRVIGWRVAASVPLNVR